MNRLFLTLLAVLAVSSASMVYTINTDRSGFSSVTLSIEGGESANVSLPADANSFRIVGGSYETMNDTAVVSSGASGITTFSFSSKTLTTKTDSGWKLFFSPAEGSAVRVYMPPFASITDSFPQPQRVSSEDSTTVLELDYSKTVSIYYSLDEVPQPAADSSAMYILAAVIIAAGAIAAALILRTPKKAESRPSLSITAGKKEMMETFNENDMKIVGYLLEQKGKAKRNELERKTGISKSSLAMALNRLEKRKIIEIDRGATTHFVRLSEYFLKL